MECLCAPSRSVGLPSGGVNATASAFVFSPFISFVSFGDVGVVTIAAKTALSRCERSPEP